MSRREFQLIEGTSQKFWSIELDGTAHAVQFGRIGTAGQSQRKEFATAAEAKASHDKLIAEKLKKGYTEVSATTAAPEPEPKAAREKPAAKAIEPAVAAPEPPPADVPTAVASLSTIRSIDLDPRDWLRATWRPRTPLPRPEPKPFDLEKCLDRFSKVTRGPYLSSWNWDKVRIAPILTREEAHFWLVAIIEVMQRDLQPGPFMQELRGRRKEFDGIISTAEAAKMIHSIANFVPEQAMVLLANLFSPHDLISLRGKIGLKPLEFASPTHWILNGFRQAALPYLSAAEFQAIQDDLRTMLGTPALPKEHHEGFPLEVHMAAAVGLHEEVGHMVRIIPDNYYDGEEWSDSYQRPQLLIFGLGDPRSVEAEMRRLKLVLKKPDYIRGWIAHTEDAALDYVRDSILKTSNKGDCAALLEVLALVKSPRTAGPMLELMLGSKAPGIARGWFDEQPGHAIAGLIPVAAGRGKVADAALDYLRAQKRKGLEGFIRDCLASDSRDAADKVRREVLERAEDALPAFDEATTPGWLRAACDEVKTLKPPTWVAPDDLRAILVGGHKLNVEQARSVLAALAASTLDAPHPLVAALKAQANRPSLDAFARSLFERWLVVGAPAKEKWSMGALGLLGSDDSALKLAPMVRAWPGENQNQRANFGLECLRAIGTDAALMQVNGIAQKLPFKALKAKAIEMMEAIARDRGLSRAELEDRIVPDCDLDERGGRLFDFGPRQFHFALGNDMKPMVRDEAGKLRDDLPKPSPKDDPARAAVAVEDWKRLKKQIREVVKVQAERLEQAIVTGRRWSPADFESLLVRHPLMTHLVRLILWGGYDEQGRLVSTFRVTEERDYADANEASYRPDGIDRVGIVHPLHLSDQQRSAWGEIFGDYEIIPPFPQLGRAVHRLEPGQEKDKDLVRGEPIKLPAATLVGTLERHGWNRGIPEDAGIFHEHSRPFVSANVTAVIQYPGIPVGAIVDWDDQQVGHCFFVPGNYTPTIYPKHDALSLGDVDPVVISEVLGTLGLLASKGK